jgi:hypothetical protein
MLTCAPVCTVLKTAVCCQKHSESGLSTFISPCAIA